MALTIICVRGPASTGKSETIREFTKRHLGYEKTNKTGDVRGIFQMRRRRYAVGVASAGDYPWLIKKGLEFLDRYEGLRVIICACHLEEGPTVREVERFAKDAKTKPHYVYTGKIVGKANRKAEIVKNVREIKRLMP